MAETYIKNLGKVCITPEGVWNKNAQYNRLCLVSLTGEDGLVYSYVSRKEVPAGIEIGNTDYWQLVANSFSVENWGVGEDGYIYIGGVKTNYKIGLNDALADEVVDLLSDRLADLVAGKVDQVIGSKLQQILTEGVKVQVEPTGEVEIECVCNKDSDSGSGSGSNTNSDNTNSGNSGNGTGSGTNTGTNTGNNTSGDNTNTNSNSGNNGGSEGGSSEGGNSEDAFVFTKALGSIVVSKNGVDSSDIGRARHTVVKYSTKNGQFIDWSVQSVSNNNFTVTKYGNTSVLISCNELSELGERICTVVLKQNESNKTISFTVEQYNNQYILSVENESAEYVEDDIPLNTDSKTLNFVATKNNENIKVMLKYGGHGMNDSTIDEYNQSYTDFDGNTFEINNTNRTIKVNFSETLKTNGGTLEFYVLDVYEVNYVKVTLTIPNE